MASIFELKVQEFGTLYHNYKGFFSLVLLAVYDFYHTQEDIF